MLCKILVGADATRLALHMGITELWIIEVENALVYSSKLLSLLPWGFVGVAQVVSTSISWDHC